MLIFTLEIYCHGIDHFISNCTIVFFFEPTVYVPTARSRKICSTGLPKKNLCASPSILKQKRISLFEFTYLCIYSRLDQVFSFDEVHSFIEDFLIWIVKQFIKASRYLQTNVCNSWNLFKKGSILARILYFCPRCKVILVLGRYLVT